MSGHPIASVVIDGIKPSKGQFRGYVVARTPLVLETAAEILSMDLPGTLAVVLGRILYYYDATDGSSAHNGTTVLVSQDGRRYKGSPNILPGTITNTELAAGAAVANIGFTPLQQGGGSGQNSSKVYIGWRPGDTTLGLRVDATEFGSLWPIATTGNLRVDTAAQGLDSTQKANARANLDLGDAALATIGVAGGVAPLDGSAKIAAAYLPSFVDDVLEFANVAAFPGSGETGKIYVALDVNKTYRWSGSVYVEISPSPGSTDAVTEGATNLYFTAARVLSALSANAATAKSNLGLAAVASSGSAADLSGTLADARLSSNVAVKNAENVFSQAQYVRNNYPFLVVDKTLSSGDGGFVFKDNNLNRWTFSNNSASNTLQILRFIGPGEVFQDVVFSIDNATGVVTIGSLSTPAASLTSGTIPDGRFPGRLGDAALLADTKNISKSGFYYTSDTTADRPGGSDYNMAYASMLGNGTWGVAYFVNFFDQVKYRRALENNVWQSFERVYETETELDGRYFNRAASFEGTLDGSNDRIPVYDASAGGVRLTSPAAIAGTNTAGVGSFNGRSGTVTFQDSDLAVRFTTGEVVTDANNFKSTVGLGYIDSASGHINGPASGAWWLEYTGNANYGTQFATNPFSVGERYRRKNNTGFSAWERMYETAAEIASISDARYLRKLSSGRLSTADASAIDHTGNGSANATNTSEINTLLSSLPSGGVLEVAQGIIYVDPLATEVNKTRRIQGLGKRISTFVLKGSSGNFYTASMNDQNLRLQVRDLSVLKANDASTTGAAFRAEYPTTSSHLRGTFECERIECRGVDGTTTFGALMRPVNAWNTKWHDLEFEGIGNSPNTAIAAVDLLGKCTVSHGDMVKAFWAQQGTRYEGGYFSEGAYLSRYHCVATNWVIMAENGLDGPGISMSMMHGETFVGIIKLLNHPQFDINDILAYKRPESTQNWTMLWLEGSLGESFNLGQDVGTIRGVRGWGGKGTAAGGTAVGMFANDCDSLIGGDIFMWDMDLGVDLSNSCTARIEFGYDNLTTVSQNVPGGSTVTGYSLPRSP